MASTQVSVCQQCPRGPSGSVLLVDDDEATRKLICAVLSRFGIRVALAANAREALDSLGAGGPPCLILLDLAMPIMDGWEFLLERQRNPAAARVPVVLMSGSIDHLALALEAEGHLAKPFTAGQLLAVVTRCCTAGCRERAVPALELAAG